MRLRSAFAIAVLAAFLLPFVVGSSAQGGQPADNGTLVAAGGAEPSILVDRVTGALVEGDDLGIHVSRDGGATWTDVTPIFIPGEACMPGAVSALVTGCTGISDGWAVAQDAAGRVYVSTTDGPFVNVASTTDDGTTWTFATAMVVTADGISDRPWLASDGAGHIAVIDNGVQGENCAYSTDGGLTFVKRTTNFGNTNAGSLSASSHGSLYYAIGGQIQRWSTPCGAILSQPIPGQGAQILTQMGIDATGAMYVAQPTPGNGAIQLLGYTSFSPLATQKSITVSDPSLQSNTFAAIDVQGNDVAVSWYGSTSAGDPSNPGFQGVWNVYVAQVHDFWSATPTVTVTQITTSGNHAGYFCMGGTGCGVGGGANDPRDLLDYQGVTHDAAGNVHLVYGSDDLSDNNPVVKYAFVAKA